MPPEPSRPVHGGYPGGVSTDTKSALLQMMPRAEWHAIEAAARADNEFAAEFYRRKAGYGLRS